MSLLAKLMLVMVQRFVTWNPSDKGSGLTLSNANLTATNSVGNVDRCVRGTTGKSSGKWRFEVTATADDMSAGRPAVGLATASHDLTLGLGGNDSVGFYNNTTYIDTSTNIGALPSFFPGAVAIEVDLDTMVAYMQPEGGTRTGPFDISHLSTPLYPILDVYGLDNSATANFGETDFTIAATSGYEDWS